MAQELFSDEIFGRRLREARQKAGMRQQDLADGMYAYGHRMHRSAIAKIESGERPASVTEAVHLAMLLGITFGEILEFTTPIDKRERQLIEEVMTARIEVHSCERDLIALESQRAQITVEMAMMRAQLNSAMHRVEMVQKALVEFRERRDRE